MYFQVILVLHCSCHKLPHTLEWLKTTQVCCLTVLRARSLNWGLQGQNRRVYSHVHLTPLGKNPFLAFPMFQKPPLFPGSCPFLHSQSQRRSIFQWLFSLTSASVSTSLSSLSFSCSPLIGAIVITLIHSDHPGQSSHLKTVNVITSAKYLLPQKATYSESTGIKIYLDVVILLLHASVQMILLTVYKSINMVNFMR